MSAQRIPQTAPVPTVPAELPDGWSAATPGEEDVDALVALRRQHEEAVRGWASTTPESVSSEVSGRGAATRRHVVVRDADDLLRGWATAHDRAAARILVAVLVDSGAPPRQANTAAAWMLGWLRAAGEELMSGRGVTSSQLDSGVFAGDERQRAWLRTTGYTHARSWWQMTRPVPVKEAYGTLPPPLPGVIIRRVRTGRDGMPAEADLRTVHDIIEAAFDDHFNAHHETFDEFISRLREDPGHRWDHWWVAELDDDPSEGVLPVGALVATALERHGNRPASSYIEYLGVLTAARGRGVGTSLVHAVIADAASRGRSHVGLEVDADSPTGAEAFYASLGFATQYVTESWHLDIAAGTAPAGGTAT